MVYIPNEESVNNTDSRVENEADLRGALEGANSDIIQYPAPAQLETIQADDEMPKVEQVMCDGVDIVPYTGDLAQQLVTTDIITDDGERAQIVPTDSQMVPTDTQMIATDAVQAIPDVSSYATTVITTVTTTTEDAHTYIPHPINEQVYRADAEHDKRHLEHPDKYVGHPRWTHIKQTADIKKDKRWLRASTILTHIGFGAKAFLYCVIGVTCIIAGSKRGVGNSAVGLTNAFDEISQFGVVVTFLTIAGLFTYTIWTVLYGLFDFDRLGHKNWIMVLKRFGQIASGVIYAVIAIDGCQILIYHHRKSSDDTELFERMVNNGGGKAFLIIAGLALEVIALVSLIDAYRGIKYKMQLRSERLGRKRFNTFVTIARVGAIGRALSFGILGGFVFEIVIYKNLTIAGGIGAVFNALARQVPFLVILLGIGLIFYGMWATVLSVHRRVPAWPNAQEAEAHLYEERDQTLPVIMRAKFTNWRNKRRGLDTAPATAEATGSTPPATANSGVELIETASSGVLTPRPSFRRKVSVVA